MTCFFLARTLHPIQEFIDFNWHFGSATKIARLIGLILIECTLCIAYFHTGSIILYHTLYLGIPSQIFGVWNRTGLVPASLQFWNSFLVDWSSPLLWLHDFGVIQEVHLMLEAHEMLSQQGVNVRSAPWQTFIVTRIATGPDLKKTSTWSTCWALSPNFAQLYMTLTHLSQLVLRLVYLAWNSSRCSPRQKSLTSYGQ